MTGVLEKVFDDVQPLPLVVTAGRRRRAVSGPCSAAWAVGGGRACSPRAHPPPVHPWGHPGH